MDAKTHNDDDVTWITDTLWGKSTAYHRIPLTKNSYTDRWYIFCYKPEQIVEHNRFAGDFRCHGSHGRRFIYGSMVL